MAITQSEAQEAQLKIYYYFMLCDGQLSASESERLSIICKEMGLSQEKKEKVITTVENRQHYVGEDGTVDTERVVNAMKNLLKSNSDTSISFSYNKKLQMSTLWNLILLANADGDVSDPEKKYISILQKKWAVEDSVISELYDTAETVTLLSKKWEWVRATDQSYERIKEQQTKIDADIERLTGYIKHMIEQSPAKGLFGLVI